MKINHSNKPKRNTWNDLYKKAKAFYEEHGYFPSRQDDHQVYIWARCWWQHGGPEKNSQKAKMLTNIGFNICSKEETAERNWQDRYNQLKAFYDEHGHFPSLTENKNLHTWATSWCVRHGGQNPEKVQLLADIGYVYQTAEQHNNKVWMKNYEEAKAFFEEHGRFPAYSENRKIQAWACQWWRNAYLMNPEKNAIKASMLETIGFVHQTIDQMNENKWLKNYNESKAFFDEHGHFPTCKEYNRLYVWANYWYRYSYQMNPEKHQGKADLLRKIGFVYNKQ